MAVERIIGVDFGTSTSVIRVKRYENGEYMGEKLETKEVIFGGNGAMVPTLVMRKDDDASVSYFGYEAQQKKKKFSNFHSFKMDLESSDPEKRALARGLTEDFYCYLAKQYKNQSDGGHLGSYDDKEHTIISYPVKWQEETKRFMLETAKKAGFPNVTGMDEAQAAIQAVMVMSSEYLQKNGLLQAGVGANILLIDMGAGTTDLVLAHYLPGETPKMDVLNTWPKSGDIQFGGREVDSLLQTYFRKHLQDEDPEVVEKIFRRVGTDKFKSWKEETVSPALRKKDSVSDFAALDERAEDEEIELEYCLDRAAFEASLADYLRQFPALIQGCLQNAGLRGDDVDLVIVTGGHSQWYFVNEILSGKMPQLGALDLTKIRENSARIIPISRPQETVALGLAYSGIHIRLSDPAGGKQTGSAQTAEHPVQAAEPVAPQPAHTPISKQEKTDFRLKFDPANEPLDLNNGTLVTGTVVAGAVEVGDHVYVYGDAKQYRRVRVGRISLREGMKHVASAHKGDGVHLLLEGVASSAIGYVAGKPEEYMQSAAKDDKGQERSTPEQVVKRFFMAYPSYALQKFSNAAHSTIDKQRVHLRVPPQEQILVAKDCTWLSSGKSGTVITPRGIYIREDFGQPDFISWSTFVVGSLTHSEGTSDLFLYNPETCVSKKVGYFLGSDCAQEALKCYEALQQELRLRADFSAAGSVAARSAESSLPDANTYTVFPGKSVHGAAMAVKDFFAAGNMETQDMQTDDGILVQARAIGGMWQQFLGLDKAISVRFTPVGKDRVTVEIGGGKWADKAIGAAVSMVVLWPLLFTSGVGAVWQAKLLKDARNVVETYFYGK